jgi:hypothetical protein
MLGEKLICLFFPGELDVFDVIKLKGFEFKDEISIKIN